MENELFLDIQEIWVTKGAVEFKEFETLKEQALQLAQRIEEVEVSEENIKTSKKLLSAVNKRVKELEDRRISIKKLMLEPYQNFENQVKEIVTIVKTADETVRSQVRAFEEMERQEKKETLYNIFEKRLSHYSFKDLFTFEDFLQPRHLNKTVSVSTVENEMIMFLEKVTKDLNMIQSMPDSKSLLRTYLVTKDFVEALTIHKEETDRKRQIEASNALKKETENRTWEIAIFEEKDFKLLKLFMEQNQIKYEILEA